VLGRKGTPLTLDTIEASLGEKPGSFKRCLARNQFPREASERANEVQKKTYIQAAKKPQLA
jgi:hypothetical protein